MKKRNLLFNLIVISVICFTQALNAQDIESGLVAYFPMNGTGESGLEDGAEATVEGAVAASEGFNGTTDGSMAFGEAGDRMSLADADITDLPMGSSSRSIAVWVKVNIEDMDNSGTPYFVNWGLPSSDPKGAHCHLAYRPSEGDVDGTVGRVRFGFWWADYDWDGIDLNDDTWHHIVVSYETDVEFAFYLDGELISAQEVNVDNAEVNTITNEVFAIGARNTPEMQDPMKGSIDEVRVYNRVLSADDVAALYAHNPDGGDEPSAIFTSKEATFSVYPNPAQNVLNISGVEYGINYKIVSITGQEAISGVTNGNDFSVDVSDLTKGIYIINIDGAAKKIFID